jgi:hypothetical protein
MLHVRVRKKYVKLKQIIKMEENNEEERVTVHINDDGSYCTVDKKVWESLPPMPHNSTILEHWQNHWDAHPDATIRHTKYERLPFGLKSK